MANTILVVGLGNPGQEYELTRHNIVFLVIDEIAKNNNLSYSEKFNGAYISLNSNNNKIIFLKPLSYMNNSGEVVYKYIDFFKIPIENVLLVYDDKDIEFSNIKYKTKGSSGGHNGIKSIIQHLKTEDIKRIKFGVNNKHNNDTAKFVLKKFSKEELQMIDDNLLQETIKIIDEKLKGIK